MTALIRRIPISIEPALERAARRLLFGRLAAQCGGIITIEDPRGRYHFGAQSPDLEPLEATVTVRDPRAYRSAVLDGELGAAEAYIDGLWQADDLVSLFRIFTRNAHLTDQLASAASWAGQLRHRLQRRLRRNSRAGSRRNIHDHYDLGNELFALFLDDTMTYSCGIFTSPGATMREASLAKLDRACRKLALGPGDHLLEIGTGWGSLAIHAASRYGCRVTTTTISEEQHRLAQERVRAAGLADRITLLCEDYRDLAGTYDKLVSIEMIEAVGHEFHDTFFRACSERLVPHGMMLLQTITTSDQRYDEARRHVDFIRRFVFPGSAIPSLTAMLTSITRATDMRLVHLEDITPHYARTLAAWRERFGDNLEAVRALGFDDGFIRLWEYYLALCQASFTERYMGDVQMLLSKPRCRSAPILPRLD